MKSGGWAQRVLREPKFGLAIVIGVIVGTPGASYIAALHQLVTSKSSTAVQAVAVVIFAVIEFSLVIVPYAFLEFRPEGTKAKLRHARGLALGAREAGHCRCHNPRRRHMAISGLVRLT